MMRSAVGPEANPWQLGADGLIEAEGDRWKRRRGTDWARLKRPKTVPADLSRARDLLTLMKPRDAQLVEMRASNCPWTGRANGGSNGHSWHRVNHRLRWACQVRRPLKI